MSIVNLDNSCSMRIQIWIRTQILGSFRIEILYAYNFGSARIRIHYIANNKGYIKEDKAICRL